MDSSMEKPGRDGGLTPPDDPDALSEFTTSLQHVKVPCAIADQDGVYIWVNDAFIATFGDVRGRPVVAIVPPENHAEVERRLARQLASDQVTEYKVDAVLANGRRVPTEVSSVRIDHSLVGAAVFGVFMSPSPATAPQGRTHLTPRQSEVLQLLADGASTDQIAAELSLSLHTVRNHIRQIRQALRAHSRLEAVVKARREGLVGD
jgi:PAS domain S-box-containing protein